MEAEVIAEVQACYTEIQWWGLVLLAIAAGFVAGYVCRGGAK